MQSEEVLNPAQEKSKFDLLNKQEWLKHIEAWQVSGLSQKAFCEQHELSFNSFSYMRSKLLAKSNNSAPACFAAVKLVHGTINSQKQLTLENKHGLKVCGYLTAYAAYLNYARMRFCKKRAWHVFSLG